MSCHENEVNQKGAYGTGGIERWMQLSSCRRTDRNASSGIQTWSWSARAGCATSLSATVGTTAALAGGATQYGVAENSSSSIINNMWTTTSLAKKSSIWMSMKRLVLGSAVKMATQKVLLAKKLGRCRHNFAGAFSFIHDRFVAMKRTSLDRYYGKAQQQLMMGRHQQAGVAACKAAAAKTAVLPTTTTCRKWTAATIWRSSSSAAPE
jgi:hypothetical protein